jgi:hypothetical protein
MNTSLASPNKKKGGKIQINKIRDEKEKPQWLPQEHK